jgi:hypothetical protein
MLLCSRDGMLSTPYDGTARRCHTALPEASRLLPLLSKPLAFNVDSILVSMSENRRRWNGESAAGSCHSASPSTPSSSTLSW